MPEKNFEIEFLKALSFEKFSVFRVMYGKRIAGYFSFDFQNAGFKYIVQDDCIIAEDELYTLAYNYLKNDLKGKPPLIK